MVGRPKLGEGETQRLQLKISAEEFAAIDDWRFTQRIASRSEAVRRLAQIGIVSYRQIEDVLKASKATTKKLDEIHQALTESVVDALGDEGIAHVVNEHFDQLSRAIDETHLKAVFLAEQMVFIQETEDLAEETQDAREAANSAAASREALAKAREDADR